MCRALIIASLIVNVAFAAERSPVSCTENSAERLGREGCTILASRLLATSPSGPVYWHIDRFNSLAAAQNAAGPDSVAAEAHGSVWLMTVETKFERSHEGHHIAWIGPLVLPAAHAYTMRVLSTFLLSGTTTPVHTHPGPEVFYIIDGEQCLETLAVGYRLVAGQSFVLPTDTIHRGRIGGNGNRRALGLVLHDAARPGAKELTDPPALAQCRQGPK